MNKNQEIPKLMCANTATTIVKKNLKIFGKCLDFKIEQPKRYEEFITTNINSSVQGTMLDTLMSWILNDEVLVDKYNILKDDYFKKSRIKSSWSDFKLKKLNNPFPLKIGMLVKDNKIFKYAYLSALLTSLYRSGYPPLFEQIKLAYHNIDSFITKEDFINFNKLLNRIIKKAQQIKTNHSFLDNPVFGTILPPCGIIKADGDYYYNYTLGDMKSSKLPTITKQYIYQLMFYNFLNNFHPIPLKIKKFEIFNPLYNIDWRVSLQELHIDYSILEQAL